jgi:hypothetical protein
MSDLDQKGYVLNAWYCEKQAIKISTIKAI